MRTSETVQRQENGDDTVTSLKCTAIGMVLIAACVAGCSSKSSSPSPTAPSQSSVAGRWIGTTPIGMIVEVNPTGYCPAEFDLDLTLTSSGTTVSGSATTRLRRTTPGQQCSDVLNGVHTYTLFNGRAESGAISFDFGSNSAYRFSGTFT